MTGLLRPPSYPDPERSRQAQLIHAFSAGWLVITTVAFLLIIALQPSIARFTLTALGRAWIVLGAAIVLNLLGRQRAATMILVAGNIIVITITALKAGGIRSPGVQSFYVLSFMAALIISRRAGLALGIACVLISLGLALAERLGIIKQTVETYNIWVLWVLNTRYVVLFVYSLIISMRSLTEALKRSEDAERMLRLSLDSGQFGAWSYDLKTKAYVGDDRTFDIFKIPVTTDRVVPFEIWRGLVHGDDLSRVLQVLDAVRAGSKQLAATYRFTRMDGAPRHAQLFASFVADERGQPFSVVGLIADVTERLEAQQERQKLEMQLRQSQKMEALGSLAGGVAHDFNNILTAITGNAFFLLRSIKSDEKMRSDVEEIVKASERASALTQQLLAFSRQQVLQPQVVGLNDVVRNIEKMLLRLLREDVKLTSVLRAERDSVKVDPGQIEQVILNLVVNARDAMPKGGTITVETSDVELGESFVGAHLGSKTGPHVMVAVSDTGTGMDAATKARLFEPFFTTKERGKGTGLGLSTTYGIIKQSGGSIYVYSELGNGTCFKVYLPREDAAPNVAPASTPASANVSGTETILLVEDDPAVRAFARRLLSESGYSVIECAGPTEARVQCSDLSRRMHLLLTDLIMPDGRGDDLAKVLCEERPDLKVVFMSGFTQAGIIHHDLGSRAVFVQKPLDPNLLLRTIRQLLDKSRSTA